MAPRISSRMSKAALQRIDRRKFLLGAGGTALALPMLEAHAPRVAFGAAAPAPRRLIVVLHPHGRNVGNGLDESGSLQDNWSPSPGGSTTYPETGPLSPMLAALDEIRNEIITIDGIDNLARHTSGHEDGHLSGSLTCLTCTTPKSNMTGGGPSIDFVAGQLLRASAAQQAALVFPASAMDADWRYEGIEFYGENGTSPTLVESNPARAIPQLFGNVMQDDEPPLEKTLHDRLLARRGSILDSVAQSYESLSRQVSVTDRERLEQHAAFIRTLETRLGGGGGVTLAQGCARPDESVVPDYNASNNLRGEVDADVTPWIIENLVMSLACDVTRVASLHHWLAGDPYFPSEFDGESPLGGGNNWHDMIHNTPHLRDPNAEPLTQAFQFHGKMFVRLIQRLSEIIDVDGSRLLDNTLVMWVSDMGYGSGHLDFNNPVVLAGMGSAFEGGQGRHIVLPERRSLGDLYAKVLRMLGGTDETFGTTGTLGDSGFSSKDALNAWSGSPGYIEASLPLHLGDIEL
ncbi:MAG TPA: DUF1552 domain-containing protein [Polyangiaceae bacterium]